MTEDKDPAAKYISDQLKSGVHPAQLVQNLISGGWQQEVAQSAVNAHLNMPPPPPNQMAAPNMYAQTGNAGVPLQVESVQYNMMMHPVESRVGFFLRLASLGLWVMIIFVASSFAAIISNAQNDSSGVGGIIVFTISIACAAIPIFLISNKKMNQELAKNPAMVDDLFFKKSTRSGLYAAIVFTAIALIAAVYNLLAAAFLKEGSGSASGFFQCFVFALCFGGGLFYYWNLHSKTRR